MAAATVEHVHNKMTQIHRIPTVPGRHTVDIYRDNITRKYYVGKIVSDKTLRKEKSAADLLQKCPGIMKITQIKNLENGRHIIYTQYKNNGDLIDYLNTFIQKNQHITLSNALYIFIEILNAIKCMHDNGIFHLDIKPQNIVLDTSHSIDGVPEITIIDLENTHIPNNTDKTCSITKKNEYGSIGYRLPYIEQQLKNTENENLPIKFNCFNADLYGLFMIFNNLLSCTLYYNFLYKDDSHPLINLIDGILRKMYTHEYTNLDGVITDAIKLLESTRQYENSQSQAIVNQQYSQSQAIINNMRNPNNNIISRGGSIKPHKKRQTRRRQRKASTHCKKQ